MAVSIGLVGARGYTGRELLALVDAHPEFELAFAASRSLAGTPVAEIVPAWHGPQAFVDAAPASVAAARADVYVLALPNGVSDGYLAQIDEGVVVVDVSADHRFDADWVYGLPELRRSELRSATRIANPGCYATAAMLALAPIADRLVSEPTAFGVSGFSGAGTTPSPRNDPHQLRDNVMPYSVTGHVHEREVGHQLGRAVRFAPSVAPFERGLVVTALAELDAGTDPDGVAEIYRDRFGEEPLVEIVDELPLPRDAVGRPHASIGGFSVDDAHPSKVGMAVALDNLLKGAASQAMQNLNLACGFEELTGLEFG